MGSNHTHRHNDSSSFKNRDWPKLNTVITKIVFSSEALFNEEEEQKKEEQKKEEQKKEQKKEVSN